jgi:hypothetical protein
MSVTNYAMGQLNPVVYFINSTGEIALPPSTEEALKLRDRMSKRGYEFREAGSLHEIDALQKTMWQQEYVRRTQEFGRTEASLAESRKAVRDRLVSRMTSSSTPQYERDFIRAYLQLRDDKREQWRNRFIGDQAARFVQRDYDHPIEYLHKIADSIPDGKDLECDKCHRFRRVEGAKVCFRCLYGIADDDLRG